MASGQDGRLTKAHACTAALPSARSLPKPYVPVLTVLIAMLLALVCVGWLIFCINHISRSISVNHIVDRIAGEALFVINQLRPNPRGTYDRPDEARLFLVRRERIHRQSQIRIYPLCRRGVSA